MRYAVICLVALVLGVPAAATPQEGAPPESQRPAPASYLFVPGDVIDVTVSSHMGYDRTITIQPDGRIQFPGAGEIVAAGLTPAQIETCFQEGLNRELVDPQVTVSLKELNKQSVRRASVLGAVKTPGTYELKQQSTLPELLASAGGPTPVADLRRIMVTRADGRQKVVGDLSGAARTSAFSSPVTLEPGDLILVPEGAPAVLVLGEVVKSGSYELQGEMRLLNALSLFCGPTPRADLRRVTLTHAGQAGQEVVDLQDLLTKGQQENLTANVVLRPGDTLVLPECDRKHYVLGEVNKPEACPLKPADHLLDAITTAGGSTHEADLSKVTLIRKDAQGQAVSRSVDLKQMMKHGDMTRNETLREGHVIFVPNRNPKRPLTDYFGFLSPLSTLLYVLK
jgi:polysaccharide biosynthesis/export protein